MGRARAQRYAPRVEPTSRSRLLAAVAFALIVGLGVHLSGQATAETSRRVEALLETEVPAAVAQQKALARDLSFKETDDYFAAQLVADSREYGVTETPMELLLEPQAYRRVVEDRKVLAPGQSFRGWHLTVSAVVDKVTYSREGASIRTRHVVARIRNRSAVPVAYYVQLRSVTRGDCPIRGIRKHNAMALRPGDSADIVVCAGTESIAIVDLREMELTELGYHYVSKVSPLSVGYELTSVRAHDPGRGVGLCSQVPAEQLRTEIREGRLQWQDVVDFYSRHNCERHHFVDGYRRAREALQGLPYRGEAESGLP